MQSSIVWLARFHQCITRSQLCVLVASMNCLSTVCKQPMHKSLHKRDYTMKLLSCQGSYFSWKSVHIWSLASCQHLLFVNICLAYYEKSRGIESLHMYILNQNNGRKQKIPFCVIIAWCVYTTACPRTVDAHVLATLPTSYLSSITLNIRPGCTVMTLIV